MAAAFALAACTQAPPPASPNSSAAENVEGVISQLEHEWVRAIVNKDTAMLDQLLADDFNGTSPTAHTYNKSMAIEDVKAGHYVVDVMDLDDVAVNAYGDVAVAFTSQEEKSRYEGTDVSGHYHFTDVWAKKDGRWQAVASHGTRYDKGH
jgi:ketosteroid isomerase-like protein